MLLPMVFAVMYGVSQGPRLMLARCLGEDLTAHRQPDRGIVRRLVGRRSRHVRILTCVLAEAQGGDARPCVTGTVFQRCNSPFAVASASRPRHREGPPQRAFSLRLGRVADGQLPTGWK